MRAACIIVCVTKLLKNTLLLSTALSFVLLVWVGTIFSALTTTTTPSTLKEALSSSGIYDAAPKLLADALVTSDSSPNRKNIAESIDRLLPPSRVESDVSAIVDQIFLWLQGDATSPVPTIQVVEYPNDLLSFINLVIQEATTSLPACLQQQSTTDFSIPPQCRPTTMLSSEQVIEPLKNTEGVDGLKDFLDKGMIDPKLLPIQPETTTKAQRLYSIYRNAPIIFIVSALPLALLVYILSKKQHFAKILSAILSIPSGINLIFAISGLLQYRDFVQNITLHSSSNVIPEQVQKALQSIIGSLLHQYLINLSYISCGVLVIGMLVLGIDYVIRRNSPLPKTALTQDHKSKSGGD